MLAADAVAGSASNATLKVLAASHPLMADSIPGAGYRRWPAAVSMGSTGAVLGLRRAGKDARNPTFPTFAERSADAHVRPAQHPHARRRPDDQEQPVAHTRGKQGDRA